MPKASVLSVSYLTEQGVPTANKDFCVWLSKTRRIASTRRGEEDRVRYETWILNQIDDALGERDGIHSVDWSQKTAVMPANASVRKSPLVPAHLGNASTVTPNHPTTVMGAHTQHHQEQQQQQQQPVDESEERRFREMLYTECINHIPRNDQQYLSDAFLTFDEDVRRGNRTYKTISLLEMVQLTERIARSRESTQQAAPSQVHPVSYNQSQPSQKGGHGGSLLDAPPQSMANTAGGGGGGAWNNTPYTNYGYSQAPQPQAPVGNNEAYRNYYGAASYDSYGQQQQQQQYPNHQPSSSYSYVDPQSNPQMWNGSSVAQPNREAPQAVPGAMDKKRKRDDPVANAAPVMYVATWNRAPSNAISFLARDVTNRTYTQFTSFLEEANAAATVPKRFVGRSKAMERKYSRDEPTVDEIRPLPVLKKAFSHIKDRFLEIEGTEGKTVAIKYLSDQLKGMRQDIHVQGIKNFFTIVVYQTHARLALRMMDLGEFNQCQSALKSLYDNPAVNRLERASISEFVAYRFAYLFLGEQYDALAVELMEVNRKATADKAVVVGVSSPVSPSERDGTFQRVPECAVHRPAPRSASYVQTSDIQWTMRLCSSCEDGYGKATALCLSHLPKNMRQLLGLFLQRYRIQWLHNHLNAFRGPVPWSHILFTLGFLPYKEASSENDGKRHQNSHEGGGKRKRVKSSPAKSTLIHNLRDPHLFWIDGSLEEADAACTALFTTIKLAMPHHHNFEREVLAALHNLDGDGTHVPAMKGTTAAVNAEQGVQTIQQYLIFLRTRDDAKHAIATHS